jgi:glycerol-3-phosphate O-acyltransferase
MDPSKMAQQRRLQEFLNREFSWRLSAGECNFLIQLIAFLVQANPPFVVNDQGEKEPLNYQSIRSMVLLNEKLRNQLQDFAARESIMMDDMDPATDRVQ